MRSLNPQLQALEQVVRSMVDEVRGLARRVAAAEQLAQQIGAAAGSRGAAVGSGVLALTGGGGIGARSGTTPGSATVTLYQISGSTLTAGATETCYNAMATSVGTSRYIVAVRDAAGQLWATAEDCP